MPPRGIVEALDVIEHVRFGLISRAVRLARRPFGLERGEEALHRGIVPDVAGPAHATGHAVVGQEPLEGLTGVLASPIGVMQDGLRLTSPPDRHHERIGDELRGHRRMHGPADNPPREQVHDRGHVEPAFGGPEIGEVGDPFAVRRGGRERPVEHIWRDGVVDRTPVSDGICRRLGRARNAACRISRSIRCRPQETPSARRSNECKTGSVLDFALDRAYRPPHGPPSSLRISWRPLSPYRPR